MSHAASASCKGVQQVLRPGHGQAAARARGHQRSTCAPTRSSCLLGPSRLRQVDDPPHPRRPDPAPPRARSSTTATPLDGLNPGVAIVFQSFALYPLDDRRAERATVVLRSPGPRRGRRSARRPRRAIRMVGPRGLRGGLSARAVRRHEAARRAWRARSRSTPRSSSWTSPSARWTRSPPKASAPRCSTSGTTRERNPSLDPHGQPRHQGGGLHGRPHRRARREPRPRAHHRREHAAPPARHAEPGVPAPRRSAPRHHHQRRAAGRDRQHRRTHRGIRRAGAASRGPERRHPRPSRVPRNPGRQLATSSM